MRRPSAARHRHSNGGSDNHNAGTADRGCSTPIDAWHRPTCRAARARWRELSLSRRTRRTQTSLTRLARMPPSCHPPSAQQPGAATRLTCGEPPGERGSTSRGVWRRSDRRVLRANSPTRRGWQVRHSRYFSPPVRMGILCLLRCDIPDCSES